MIHVSDATGQPVVRWTPNLTATGLTFTGSNSTHPCYNSHYVKVGKLVTFYIEIDLATVTNFGTGQIKTELPFMPLNGSMNHFTAWSLVDPTANPDIEGHVVLQADNLANTQVLDLHWYRGATAEPKPIMESLLTATSPVVLTTASKIYINGTYITN